MMATTVSVQTARRLFVATFGATLVLKLVWAIWFPMTGDEAFFYQWGVRPDWGYSDHPPMVGWWLAGLMALGGDSPWALRLATVGLTSVIALGLVDLGRRLLPPEREDSAWLGAAVYLVLPWSWLLVLVTTDTPLIFFMALSAYCYVRADAQGRLRWYALAGLFVGLAFLSKYFAALLGLAYAVHVLGWRRARWWSLPLMFALALPSIALNLVFNAFHGWPNVMFNFVNRHEGAQWSWQTVALYAATLAYLFTPWWLWQAVRAGGQAMAPAGRAVAVLLAFPLLVFAVFSLRRDVGMHWVLGFVPLFALWATLRLGRDSLRRAWRWTVAWSVPHALVVAAIVWAPLAWWPASWLEKGVFLREAPAIVQALQRDGSRATLMAYAYSPSAVLAYHAGVYVPTFGVGRHHARQDDQVVDFRVYDGQPLRIFLKDPALAEPWAPYFERTRLWSFEVAGVTYHALDGEGFHYAAYREGVLAEVVRRFYQIPGWLPLRGSPFCERYGFKGCSPE
jgi:4-amino-4-deoxy-L-arabinose transferase-like glycosyltransferase